MSKFIPFLALILIVGFAFYQLEIGPIETLVSIFEGIKEKVFPEKEAPLEEEKEEEGIVPEEEIILPDRAEKFFISSGKTPPIFTKEVIVDPFKVKEREKQTFSIWAEDPQGIKKVTATISTDEEDEIIELELVEGTETEGRWQGSWITKNISTKSSYSTVFQAENKEGNVTKMPLSWQIEK